MSDAVHLDAATELRSLANREICGDPAWFELRPRTFCAHPKGHCGPHQTGNTAGGTTGWSNDECDDGGDGGGDCGRPHRAR